MTQKSLNERIAVLETTQEHMQVTIDKMAAQLNEVHNLLIAAKGARWAVVGVAMFIGFITANINYIASVFGLRPY
jgi:hypothetical protein